MWVSPANNLPLSGIRDFSGLLSISSFPEYGLLTSVEGLPPIAGRLRHYIKGSQGVKYHNRKSAIGSTTPEGRFAVGMPLPFAQSVHAVNAL
jgi:hypothetical protein